MSILKTDRPEVIKHVTGEVARIVTEMCGVRLGDRHTSMIESRLRARILRMGLRSFENYLDHLQDNIEAESQALLSLLTTHHTYFFREFNHFEYLINHGLETLIEKARTRGDRKIRIWSAACSRGQEVYSLAMFFAYHLKEMAPDVDFEIWGTDVDPESVAYAKNGVYPIEELNQIPAMYATDQWLRGRGPIKNFAKVSESLKAKTRFEPLNLLKPGTQVDGRNFDVIFCRNVFIYFDREQIVSCIPNLLKHMRDDGFFILGVAESLSGMGLPLESVAPSVFRKPQAQKTLAASKPTVFAAEKILRVLCVDDSPAILALMKKIFAEEHGFKLVGTASDGRAAIEWLKREKCDVMTLDIHMPELDGVGFLEATQNSGRPPVLVVSSVNREDPALGKKVLSLGAYDYVEKPALENVAQAGNEIRAKLRLAARQEKSRLRPSKPSSNFETKTSPVTAAKSSSAKKVLVVDDSSTVCQLLRQILSADPSLEVVAVAHRPGEVEGLIQKFKPDVITLDIQMPEMNGLELLQKIFPVYRIPTVMISAISREEGPLVLQALESGAVDYIQKPSFADLKKQSEDICERVKAAASTRRNGERRAVRRVKTAGVINSECLVLLGASTGGTEALRHIFEGFPAEIPPTLVVQHIPPVFSAAFAARLNNLVPFDVKEASDGDEVRPNRILIAAGGRQMAVVKLRGKLVVRINDDPPVNRHRPSVDYLFQSALSIKHPNIVAALLTGMGADGARGLKALRDANMRTIAQDQATSVIYGMPGAAVAMGAAEHILPLDDIAEKIIKLATNSVHKKIAS